MLRPIKGSQRLLRQHVVRIGTGSAAVTFLDAAVNATTDIITIAGHGLITGDRVVASTTGTLPAGLTAIKYWVIRASDSTIQLASSLANALAGTAVNITAAAGGGTHTLTDVSVLEGLDRLQMTLQDQAVGHWKLTFAQPFAQVPHAFGIGEQADTAVTTHAISASAVEVKLNAIDETAALQDGEISVLIIGSDADDVY